MTFCKRCGKDVHPVQEISFGGADASGRTGGMGAVFSSCPTCSAPLNAEGADEPTGDEFAPVVKTSMTVATVAREHHAAIGSNVVDVVRARRDALVKRVAELRMAETELLQLEAMLEAAERIAPRLEKTAGIN